MKKVIIFLFACVIAAVLMNSFTSLAFVLTPAAITSAPTPTPKPKLTPVPTPVPKLKPSPIPTPVSKPASNAGSGIVDEKANGKARAKIIASTNFNVALKEDGTVWCWGSNIFGTLGDGSYKDKYVPVHALGMDNVIDIAVGESHALALKNDGTVWSWGLNSSGQLGDGTTDKKCVPVKVKGLDNVALISANSSYSMAIKNDGTIWYWGGFIRDFIKEPKFLQKEQNIVNVCNVGNTALFLKSDKSLWTLNLLSYAFGLNKLPYEDVSLTARGNQRFSIKSDGTIKTEVHFNKYKEEVDEKSMLKYKYTVPYTETKVITTSAIVSCSANNDCFMAVDKEGKLKVWARSLIFDPGIYLPFKSIFHFNVDILRVDDFTDIEDITVGFKHAVATKRDGTVWCWGDNTYGQLGNGSNTPVSAPIQVKDFFLFGNPNEANAYENTTQQGIQIKTTASAIVLQTTSSSITAPTSSRAISNRTIQGTITSTPQPRMNKLTFKVDGKVDTSINYISTAGTPLRVQADSASRLLGVKFMEL